MKKILQNKIWLGLVLLLIFTTAIYWQVVGHDFIYWDDQFQVVTNLTIRSFDLPAIFKKINLGMYTPITSLSYALDYKLFGLNPGAFHLSSLFYHLLNICLVFCLAYLVIKNKTGALSASAIFALHPFNIESVAWISARSSLIFLAFFLASFIAQLYFWRNKNNYLWLASLVLFVLACLAKSSAIILAPILLVTYWYYYKKIDKFIILRLLPFFAVSLGFGVLTIIIRLISGHSTEPAYHYLLSHWLFFTPYALSFYLAKTIVPFNLCSFYPLPVLKNNLLPWTYYICVLIFPLWLTILIYLKKYRREIIFFSSFYLLSLILVLKFSKIATLVTADRYYYLPSVGIAIALIFIGQKIIEQLPHLKKIIILSIIGYILFLSAITYFHLAVWKNDIVKDTNVIEQNGDNLGLALIYGNRGSTYLKQGNWQSAFNDFSQAIKMKPTDADSYDNMAIVKADYLHNPKQALIDSNIAINLKPNMPSFYYNRGNIFLQLNDLPKAIENFSQALSVHEVKPGQDSNFNVLAAYFNQGLAYYNLKKYHEAVQNFQQVNYLNSTVGASYYFLGLAQINLKDPQACSSLQTSLALNYPEAKSALTKLCPNKK